MRRLMTECTKDGTSLEKMGFFKLPGIREYLIEPYAFQKYLEAKIIVQPKYDYEVENHNEVKNSLKVIHNKQRKEANA